MNLINNKDMLQDLFNSNEEIHKLYKYGQDQNTLHIQHETDQDIIAKLVIFEDLNDEKYQKALAQVDTLLFLIHAALMDEINIVDFHSFWLKIFRKIQKINSTLPHHKS